MAAGNSCSGVRNLNRYDDKVNGVETYSEIAILCISGAGAIVTGTGSNVVMGNTQTTGTDMTQQYASNVSFDLLTGIATIEKAGDYRLFYCAAVTSAAGEIGGTFEWLRSSKTESPALVGSLTVDIATNDVHGFTHETYVENLAVGETVTLNHNAASTALTFSSLTFGIQLVKSKTF